MSFKEKNIAVTLVNFSLILIFFLFRVFQMIQKGSFNSDNVFRLWGINIALAVFVTIAATVLTQIVSTIIKAIRTGEENPEIDSLDDERDRLIDLRGTKVTFFISSIGAFLAMLTFVLGQPPLVMFTLLIFFGVLAQVIGDITRLVLYRGGF
jgi:hypothetical protein